MTLELGTPLWAGGFGTVTWLGEHFVGATFLADGLPTIRCWLPVSGAQVLAEQWRDVVAADGRVTEVVVEYPGGPRG